ncbi:hypothetical protein GmHk_03G007307 [Glycine max]|nr:hypothetical protein GmHk_03G007307 [Glycine max]
MWLYDNLNVLVYDAYVLKMDEDQWTYDYTMSQEVHMDYDYDNEEECGVNEPHVDCSNAFNTSQVFGTRDDVLQWAQTVAHENGFVAVIMRLRGKPVHGGKGWMVKLICEIHNHELTKSLVRHPYAGRLTKDEKKIIADMTKLMTVDSTYKTNSYRLPLLDFVGVTPTTMTFSAGFTYLKAESVNNIVWALERFRDQELCEAEVSIKEEIETISKRFEKLDVSSKVTLKSKLQEIAYPDQNSMCPPSSKVNTKGAPKKPMKRSQRSTKRDPSYWEYVDVFHSVQSSNSSVKCSALCSEPPQPTRIIPMLDQFAPFIQGFIRDVVDVKADSNCGYRSIAALLGMGEDLWPLVHNELIKELGRWSHEYMNLFGGTERFEQLKLSLVVNGFSKVSVDKWMDITEMGYVIASRYNVILVSLSRQQSMTFFPLRSQPPPDSSRLRMICVGHVFGNHFVQVYLKDHCPLPPPALLWSSNCYSQAKQWTTPYISRMQQYTSLMSFKRHYVDLNED